MKRQFNVVEHTDAIEVSYYASTSRADHEKCCYTIDKYDIEKLVAYSQTYRQQSLNVDRLIDYLRNSVKIKSEVIFEILEGKYDTHVHARSGDESHGNRHTTDRTNCSSDNLLHQN